MLKKFPLICTTKYRFLNDYLWLQGALGEDGPAGAMGDQGPEVCSETFQSWLFFTKENQRLLRNLEG